MPWLRIGSISSGFSESNTSHTVSARRNNAAGVAVAKENISRRPSLSRLALTGVALSAALACGGGSGAASVMFGGACAAGAGISFDGGAAIVVSSVCTSTGLTSIFACCAKLSGAGGAISPDCCDAGGSAGFSDARGAGAAGAPDTGAADAGAAGAGAPDAGAADAGACEASGAGDATAEAFSARWKATSIM